MRAEVAAIAGDLMLERGYERTTVEDICAAAEISRSTFFRYFPSKEDALFGLTLDAGEDLREALVARPDSETPWTAMRRALDPLIEKYEADDERVRLLTRLVVTTPALLARHQEKNARWHELLRAEVSRRLGADPDDRADPRVDALVGASLACVHAALTAWTTGERPGVKLSVILDRAMDAIA
ncbi:TetR family transcriptional regulator [Myceligenerans sp. TRM 65318]|uniref:TetR family transcriptional regulator n=2 Tax=Myceligenerans pegani TaxID=2776917 RepID=A0ABR9N5S5_9MICO|nr:TetR family transcriptional regulator [Myceligenerans sp. TRM 65318]MBE3020724.1 TetR family transcriptional regulator [Myceligenerans sp. TRM 65318]